MGKELEYHDSTLRYLKIKALLSEAYLNQLEQKEIQFDIRLPAAFREWYSLEEHAKLLNSVPYQAQILSATDWRIDKADPRNPMLIFWYENQWTFALGIPLGDVDDPVVYKRANEPGEVWKPFVSCFSTFIYLIFKCPDETLAIRWDDDCYPLTA